MTFDWLLSGGGASLIAISFFGIGKRSVPPSDASSKESVAVEERPDNRSQVSFAPGFDRSGAQGTAAPVQAPTQAAAPFAGPFAEASLAVDDDLDTDPLQAASSDFNGTAASNGHLSDAASPTATVSSAPAASSVWDTNELASVKAPSAPASKAQGTESEERSDFTPLPPVQPFNANVHWDGARPIVPQPNAQEEAPATAPASPAQATTYLNEDEESERNFDESTYEELHASQAGNPPVSLVVPSLHVPDAILDEDEPTHFGPPALTEQEKAAARERWAAKVAAAPVVSETDTPWLQGDAYGETHADLPDHGDPVVSAGAEEPILDHLPAVHQNGAAYDAGQDVEDREIDALPPLASILTSDGHSVEDQWKAIVDLENNGKLDDILPALSLDRVVAGCAALVLVGQKPRSEYEQYLAQHVDADQAHRILNILAPAIGY